MKLDYEIKLELVLKHDDGKWQWAHARVAPISKPREKDMPAVVMTLLRSLPPSDHYSATYFMKSDDMGKTWSEPVAPPELDWEKDGNDHIAVADVTPGYHPKTGKIIAIGAQVRYNSAGRQIKNIKRAQQTAYAVYELNKNKWKKWRRLEVPADDVFDFARSACAQWIVKPDGNLLVPLYIGRNASEPYKVTVGEYKFDGDKLIYIRHGNILELKVARGLSEPSLTCWKDKYYLTIRNDERGYVTVSDDGLDYKPVKPWKFDDGSDLGSYNTQQHWVTHNDALFLVYTRRGANNDHIMRHRAPLFIAQFDPEKMCIVRSTEKTLVPERGAGLGNFGATAINAQESWVTVAEAVGNNAARKRGAEGAVFVVRIIWNKLNNFAEGARID